MFIFIAITKYKDLTNDDVQHFLDISDGIDGLLFRTPMSSSDLSSFLTSLIEKGFPKSKIIIHSDVHLLEQLHLSHIHFREMDEDAFSYKSTHPEIEVSMSTHSIESVKAAYEHDLDYVFFGHIFKTPSKPNQLPRSKAEIQRVLEIPIPIYAIGGITEKTIPQLPHGFKGICAISFFMNASLQQIELLRKEWLKDA
ncbi:MULTISPECIES: thiamine phosphate synthase [Staphylococcus]|jgi:thiazole tautomerase (transcriptional regulator TenI)|uniref:thiamine phosphate synthase n=1 Tax=Staphylococcus TaxID=1279 RepID=UPI00065FA2F4|nr:MULTISPECIES: thiamine phosphate synthase [Staphylococcus]OFK84369.1 thiamine phosphate synthase [Staphylococcus sp. HMSC057A02]OFM95276.1 thiamine phosphate synthase [Staphylococcus sp. HMSC078D05]AUW63285.1 thiamine phosphate synthase [Staphylococcus hominis]MBC2955794.1 thiamine phosphate synthase [Staphylococcus hominis]MBC3060632.1 thiamine phosphate synthase [Staphylococcus hominis]